MRIGLLCLGIGPFGGPEWMAEAGTTAERVGFSSIFVGEHFAFFENYRSPYPYLPGGDLPVPASADILDAFITLTWLAAHTSTIRLGTGVAILPERNPLITAKQVASLDQLCGGRLVFGAGAGWSQEEYEAVGVPWERRWARMDEYVEAMRCLWQDPLSSFDGEFVRFENALSYPKPMDGREVPVFYGGNGPMTLRRVARNGQGWMGMNIRPDEAAERVDQVRTLAAEAGRTPSSIEMTMLSSQWPDYTPDDYKRFADAGMDEIICFGHSGPAVTEDNARTWVQEVARATVDVAAQI